MTAPALRGADGCYEVVKGQRWPSVTTICGQLDKPALVAWAARQAAEYAWERRAVLGAAQDAERDGIVRDLAGAHRRTSRDAAGRGTSVHDVLARLASGEEIHEAELPSVVTPYLDGVRAYLAECVARVVWTERTVYHPRHGYAGTLDGIHRLRGGAAGVYVVDVKTVVSEAKATIYPEHRLQLAGYRACTHATRRTSASR